MTILALTEDVKTRRIKAAKDLESISINDKEWMDGRKIVARDRETVKDSMGN